MNKFLLKINENDRDCVKYIDTEEIGAFECGHYFVGLRINGACFSGYLEEIKEQNFKNITTILTEEELKRLFEFDEKIRELGYGIVQGDKRYQKGLEYKAEIQDIIDKLNGKDNEKLFEKVQEEEKEVLKKEYDLTDEDIDYIFDNYGLEYRDKCIIYKIKKDIVLAYEEVGFTETVMWCSENNYITKEREKYYLENCMEYPYPKEDNYYEYKIEIIDEFFNELGIDDILFKQIVKELEDENKI